MLNKRQYIRTIHLSDLQKVQNFQDVEHLYYKQYYTYSHLMHTLPYISAYTILRTLHSLFNINDKGELENYLQIIFLSTFFSLS